MEDINTLSSYVKESRDKQLADTQNEHRIIAESSMMKEIIRLVDMVKNTETSVLITGETGVGKGVLARYIHNTSNRADKRMMEINCGAIPDALLESGLFGYESGAFTGADRKGKPGLIEMSEGGTLFWDEISELPLLLQVKRLHFLQSRSLTRVGGTKEIQINARVIAASNRDFKVEVEKGMFRSDLYYRLNVIPITIQPLRERREDIGPAALYFFDKYMRKYGKSFDISEGCLERLYQCEWPGNVRELENCIERIVVTNGMDTMESQRAILKEPQTHPTMDKLGQVYEEKNAQTLKEMEEELVVSAFEKYRSSYKVAEVLGISQTAAYRKIKKYVK